MRNITKNNPLLIMPKMTQLSAEKARVGILDIKAKSNNYGPGVSCTFMCPTYVLVIQ